MGVISKKKKTLLSILVLVSLFVLTFYLCSCDTLEELTSTAVVSEDNGDEVAETEEVQENTQDGTDAGQEPEDTTPQDEEAGEENDEQDTTEDTDTQEQEEVADSEFGELTIDVYYADSQAQYLVGEKRVISRENKLMDALFELLKLPTDTDLVRIIPETTKILGITVENGIADIDLSQEFLDDRFISDTVDILLVYSVVNTMTEFNEIDAVNFFVEGQKLDILGELDIKNPIYRRNDLIAE